MKRTRIDTAHSLTRIHADPFGFAQDKFTLFCVHFSVSSVPSVAKNQILDSVAKRLFVRVSKILIHTRSHTISKSHRDCSNSLATEGTENTEFNLSMLIGVNLRFESFFAKFVCLCL